MSANRRDTINLYIQSKGEVRISELERLLPDFSGMTIRRDLKYLEQRGEIVLTRGGAKSISHLSMIREAAYTQRVGENTEAKMLIAEKASQFVLVGRSLYIDAGTTGTFFAQKLKDENLFVLTSAPNIAMELIKNHHIKVSLTGGKLNRETLSLSGYNAAEYIKTLNIDIAFMGASAFTLNSGFSCGDFAEAEIKRLIMRKAQTNIMLMDSSKIGNRMPYSFSKLTGVDILITDIPLPKNYLAAAKKAKVTVI
jgi:DeoR family transcriptional regulator, fructose operon transcriptional repressor